MPELSDDMYCSQQIMVPPMFPYILRQYAKAAIRSQPSDLLRWSTAYFRCLSLNLPPPVKPRLEYPLPKDYDGVTPGWLKALLYQLINNTHVDFKVLWDRWIGACQNHLTLIKILCLGGFSDPYAVPLFRFIGLCVGFLNENLTQTMIMFCEVVTEEPEGGSAMISVETFIDVYTFLAGIDAAHDVVLMNRFFTDELLALLEKKEETKVETKKKEIKLSEKETSVEVESVEEEAKIEDERKEVISCPDLTEDVVGLDSSDDILSKATLVDDKEQIAAATGKTPSEIELERQRLSKKHVRHSEIVQEMGAAHEDAAAVSSGMAGEEGEGTEEGEASALLESEGEALADVVEEDKPAEEATEVEPVDDLPDEREVGNRERDSDASLVRESGDDDKLEETSTDKEEEEPLVKTDIVQYLADEGLMGESMGYEEVPEVVKEAPEMAEVEYSVGEPEVEPEEEAIPGKFEVEEIFIESIPGIGPIVPPELVDAVVTYMKKCAEAQHGMVMPRNIRHYSCPPLEVYDK